MMFLCWITYFSILITVVYGNFARKIYGGERVSIFSFPYQVSVQIRNYHICGGSIISENHVLTGASCVMAEQNVMYGNIQVLAGTPDITDYQYGKIHQVSHVIFHEFYNPRDNWINDIAILQLETPIIFMRRLSSAAKLPSRKSFSLRYHHVTGWGIDPITHDLSTHLQRFEVQLITQKVCKRQYYQEFMLSETQYCFIPFLPSTGISQGGGGSPIMFGQQIIGIVSIDSLDANQPIIYTHVFEYNHWIQNMMKKL